MSIGQAQLVQRIRWHLGDTPWETTGGADDGVTNIIDVEEASDWQKGEIGEFADNGESFYVRNPNPATSSLLTTRGYYGSEATLHITGTRIFKKPRYAYTEITNAISEIIEFRLPWPRFYTVNSVVVTPDPENTEWYDVGSSIALIRATQLYGEATNKQKNYNTRHLYDRVEFSDSINPTLCASGCGIKFIDGFNNTDNNVEVQVASLITDTVASESYTDFSLGDPITAAIEYGAVSLLQGSLELRKPRHAADEVDYLRGASVFDNLHQRALRTAEKRLRQLYPLAPGWDK